MRVDEIQRWLDTMEPDQQVYVDEGGLALVTYDREGCRYYFEVGGEPESDPEQES